MNITIKIIKALFEPIAHLYINYDNNCTSIVFRKHYGEYKSNEILLDASIAEYLVENGYITIYSTMVDDLYKNLNLYTFILTSKSLLLIL